LSVGLREAAEALDYLLVVPQSPINVYSNTSHMTQVWQLHVVVSVLFTFS